MRTSYTDQQLKDAIASSYSIAETLRKLSLVPAGGNYRTIHRKIKQLSIDTKHFKGQGWLKGKTHNFNKKIPLEEILVKNRYCNSSNLRIRLLGNNLKERKCEECNRTKWSDKPIPLELDHINGNPMDNRIENLRIICPNCHAQTPTYRGKNKQAPVGEFGLTKRFKPVAARRLGSNPSGGIFYCIDPNCNKKVSGPNKRCKSHAAQFYNKTKINWPSIKKLKERLAKSNYSKLARELGVSDNAIRKRLKRYENK